MLARRLVADRCLYGVDINGLAVEMAKLSLWLITLQKNRPFSFLDHALKAGNSLLGIAETRQLDVFSLRGNTQIAFEAINLWRHLEAAEAKRAELEALPSETPDQIAAKMRLHAEAEILTQRLKATADLLIALELEHLPAKRYADQRAIVSSRAQYAWTQQTADAFTAEARAALNGRHAFHWPLEFPEVFSAGGFDAFLGNPPFMGGQKITGNLGTDLRDYLVNYLADGKRGSADLVAYFFLRAIRLLKAGGTMGLIAVNTIAEGDTRQAALEPLLASGHRIYNASPNQPWPNVAAVVVSLVHLAKSEWRGTYHLNGDEVPTISAYLSAEDETSPQPLVANAGKSYIGSYVLGMGFTLSEETARAWIAEDPRNADVLFPYLNGEDLNSHPQQQASRWVINFWDWPEARAQTYEKPFKQLLELVKPERQRKDANGNFELRKPLPERWWQYGEKRPALYHAIGRGYAFENHPEGWAKDGGHWPTTPLPRVLVIARASKTGSFSLVPNNMVFSEATVVFEQATFSHFACVTTSLHSIWAWKQASKLKTDLRYSPTDAYETFPFPTEGLDRLEEIGEAYDTARVHAMSLLNIGLTQIAALFNDSECEHPEITLLRNLHRQIDEAVAIAYGWRELNLDHGFHSVPYLPENDRVRYTISEPARLEVLRRLSRLNRERHAEEQREAATPRMTAKVGAGRKPKLPSIQHSLL